MKGKILLKKAALHNLGCKVNAYETEAMRELLEKDGYEIVPFHEKADVYVINTCTVTNVADRKSRQMINRARKENPDAVIIAAGCYVQTARDRNKDESDADILIGNNKKEGLIPTLHEFLLNHHKESEIIDINSGQVEYEDLRVNDTEEHTRAFLKVQDGCNQFCSYCLIPFARGRARSRDKESIIEEIRHFAEKGYKEVVITGIHLSSYGEGMGYGLIELLEEANIVNGIKRIRLGSIEPRIITEEFVKRVSRLENFCPHFHISLQSGCDKTLIAMNRKYTTSEFKHSCDLIRKYFFHPAITTDVITGFPGETAEDFEESRAFTDEVSFYEMHVFKFSRREGTKADKMPGQLTESIKAERSHVLIEQSERNSRAFREEIIGKETEVLIEFKEDIDDRSYWTGLTREYIRIAIPADVFSEEENPQDQIYKGISESFLTDECIVLDRSSIIKVQ
ncbi:MAG: tRNA (N(6)-L-threonylcarbamoyladenosine(37)-C(2))-methylthiotransferase MtaB [Lachnospiraceae bacterium]|nr:tRNA (N(6)-L-threonylcarbamoyladenosine(37)-C(2))-methylthiotransferase MtaB [Lachnospiraceae bacterium]